MKAASAWVDDGIEREFEGARLGDVRRSRRLVKLAVSAAEKPDVGLPRMVASTAELEGIYRLLSNEHVNAVDIAAPHLSATLARAREAKHCLVLHDSTYFEFPGDGHREGLGLTAGKAQGFLTHLALAVMPGEARVPLGVCGWRHVVRTSSKNTRSKSWYEMSKDPTRESLRWVELLRDVEESRTGFTCIHVMDREGDVFDLMTTARSLGARFVIRAAHDRALADVEGRLRARIADLRPMTTRKIELSARSDAGRTGAARGKHPARRARVANVAIAGCEVTLKRTLSAQTRDASVTVNVVRVWEKRPPSGEHAVEWILYTTEPIATKRDLEAVVDAYRSRWLIEEYFKALKTGCAFERRQLESFHALSNVLAVFMPIAWKMLLARSVSRAVPDAPADCLLDSVQLALLRHKLELKTTPQTVEAATFAVARLGGHLRHNGRPGWQTLARGFEALAFMQAGWTAAQRARSDQS